jgi:hypothetical protein
MLSSVDRSHHENAECKPQTADGVEINAAVVKLPAIFLLRRNEKATADLVLGSREPTNISQTARNSNSRQL